MAAKTVARTTADHLTLCRSLSFLPMSPCLSRTHKDNPAHLPAPARRQQETLSAVHPVRLPNGARRPRCLLSLLHQQQPTRLTCPGCHTRSRMARPIPLEHQEDFPASEDRDFMPCHRWLPCVTDKHLKAGDRSVFGERRDFSEGFSILAIVKGRFQAKIWRGKEKVLREEEFLRYRALLGVCDLCYSASLLQGPFLGDGRACSASAESDMGTESLLT